MAKRIALVVLTLALVGTWGVLPAMAYDCPEQVMQAEKLLKKADLRAESPATVALVEEAARLLFAARHGDARGKADWVGKTAQELAAEIAAQPSL